MASDYFHHVTGELLSRRDFNRRLRPGAVLFGASALGGGATATHASKRADARPSVTDEDVMNFALNLEYLEAEFYLRAVRNTSLVELGVISPADITGATVGGKLVPNLGADAAEFVGRAIGDDEMNHVKFFRSTLGSTAVKKPAIDLNALGFGFASTAEFLKLARILEDIGVSAFNAAAGLLADKGHLEAAARILATEAEHSGAIRFLALSHNVQSPAFDDLDVPPTKDHPFPVDSQRGMTMARGPQQVLGIVYGGKAGRGGFYPEGLNGAVK